MRSVGSRGSPITHTSTRVGWISLKPIATRFNSSVSRSASHGSAFRGNVSGIMRPTSSGRPRARTCAWTIRCRSLLGVLTETFRSAFRSTTSSTTAFLASVSGSPCTTVPSSRSRLTASPARFWRPWSTLRTSRTAACRSPGRTCTCRPTTPLPAWPTRMPVASRCTGFPIPTTRHRSTTGDSRRACWKSGRRSGRRRRLSPARCSSRSARSSWSMTRLSASATGWRFAGCSARSRRG